MKLKRLKTRLPLIAKLVKDKSVLHIGFADSGVFRSKMASDTWLHDWIVRSALNYAGLDIDVVAVRALRNLGYMNIYSNTNPMVEQTKWDYIVMGELIEHLDNPVSFLQDIKRRFPDSGIIVTVPNAFCLKNFVNAFKGKENVHYDHRFWFTPYTIQKVLYESGYRGYRCELIESYERGFFTSLFLILFPFFRSTIIVVV